MHLPTPQSLVAGSEMYSQEKLALELRQHFLCIGIDEASHGCALFLIDHFDIIRRKPEDGANIQRGRIKGHRKHISNDNLF